MKTKLPARHSDPELNEAPNQTRVNPKYRLPAGLPACVADGKSGLKVLQDLFGLANRKAWQAILHAEPVRHHLEGQKLKLRGLTTSQKVERRILAFYGSPDARSEDWEVYVLGLATNHDPDRIPSLEHAALERYDPEFYERDFDFDRAEWALGDVVGFRHSRRISSIDEPALAVWPDLRDDLLRWDEIPADRQEAAVLATFAVASIIDDVRILEWASARSARLAEEFAFAVRDSAKEAAEPAGSGALGVSEPMAGPARLLEEWDRSCDLITEIASDLKSNSPKLQRLDDLVEPVKQLEALRSEMTAAIDLRKRQDLVRRVVETLTACAKEFDAPWIDGIRSQVCALWQIAWCLPPAVREDELERDLDRLRDHLTGELRQWCKFETAKEDHRAELVDLRISADSDLESQLEAESREQDLQELILKAARQATSCKRRIVAAIAPAGHEFDTSKDYQAELEEALATPEVVEVAVNSDSTEGASSDDRFSSGPGPAAPSGSGSEMQVGGEGSLRKDRAATSAKRRTAKRGGSRADRASTRSRSEAVKSERFWDRPWEEWLERIGDPSHADSVRPWNSTNVPVCPVTSPFADPVCFAESLGSKLKSGVLESPRHTLLALAEFLGSDPQKGRKEWKEIYREILNYCVRGNLDVKDSQAIAFALISLSLKAGPGLNEYRQLVDSADRLTAQTSDFEDVKWALELSNPFLLNRCPDQGYLAVYLENICKYVSTSGYHLSSKHQAMQAEIQKFLRSANGDATPAPVAARSVQDFQRLSRFLKGKSVVIYTLQLSAAQIARERIRAIEASADIRLLHNTVWSDSLQDPIRNADLCVMVKSAATHAVTEMISRTRRNVGKEVIVSWNGVHSLIRAIETAAGLGEGSALVSGIHGGRAVA